MPTPDDITSLFTDDRDAKRAEANQEARRREEEYAQNHAVEAYGDPAPQGIDLVGSDIAWRNLEDHLQKNRPLLNDSPEWRANYAEMDQKRQLAKDAERFGHLRRRDGGHGRER